MDIFNSPHFSMLSLTTGLEKVEYQPTFIRSLNLFTPDRIRTKAAAIEERDGVLNLIPASQRGEPLGERTTEKRVIRYFDVPRIAKGDTVTAAEIQDVRAFGSETELMQVQAEVARRLNGPAGLMREVELTWENMALGAVQGIVVDSDGSTVIKNYFTEFGVTQPTEIDFDLDNASPASGAVRKLCSDVTRAMQRAAKGAWVMGQSYALALCGDNFWDDLTAHSEVRQTYLNTQQAADLREGLAFESFRYGGITWVNYRGTDDNSKVAIPTDLAKFLPVMAPGVFRVVYAPGEFFGITNQPGRDVYALIVRDKDRDAWVRPEVYSYPLYMCTRPLMLQRARRT
jgi:hypothetical protein